MKLTPQILALYIGCEVQCFDGVTRTLTGVCQSAASETFYRVQTRSHGVHEQVYWCDLDEVKPILRRLSSMTEEEARQYCRLQGWGENMEKVAIEDEGVRFQPHYGGQAFQNFRVFKPEAMVYLLAQHFDLFNLIQNNLAIEKP